MLYSMKENSDDNKKFLETPYIFFIILEIKESFHKIDLNGDGRLSRRELMKAAAILGMNPTDKDIDAMMKDVDKNSTSKLQITCIYM